MFGCQKHDVSLPFLFCLFCVCDRLHACVPFTVGLRRKDRGQMSFNYPAIHPAPGNIKERPGVAAKGRCTRVSVNVSKRTPYNVIRSI